MIALYLLGAFWVGSAVGFLTASLFRAAQQEPDWTVHEGMPLRGGK
jgi:hypothetical protein